MARHLEANLQRAPGSALVSCKCKHLRTRLIPDGKTRDFSARSCSSGEKRNLQGISRAGFSLPCAEGGTLTLEPTCALGGESNGDFPRAEWDMEASG